MTSVPIKTAVGTADVSATPLPDGSMALNHVPVNPDGTFAAPALDATMQQIATSLQTLTTTLTGFVKIDPGTF